jgi:hypothetical protein
MCHFKDLDVPYVAHVPRVDTTALKDTLMKRKKKTCKLGRASQSAEKRAISISYNTKKQNL